MQLTYFTSTKHGWVYYLGSAFVFALALFVNLNASTKTAESFVAIDGWDDSDFSYLEEDYPPSLIPLSKLPRDSALVIEDTVHYLPNTSSEWASLFPAGTSGFVRLGPSHRLFGVSMFHQLHCLDKMRRAVNQIPPSEWERWHTQHCLNYVRQMLLCASSVRVEPVKVGMGRGPPGLKVDGLGLEHSCRDWSILRRKVEENYEHWPEGAYP